MRDWISGGIPLPELKGDKIAWTAYEVKSSAIYKGRSKFVNKTYLLIMLPFILPNTPEKSI